MNAEAIVRIIQLILAPAVMVTTCAILLGGMQGHYAAVNDRLRSMAHERLDLLLGVGHSANPDAFVDERLRQIDHQLPEILRRHKRIRDAVMLVYCGMLIFILSMIAIAAAVITASAWFSIGALLVFLAATSLLFLGIVLNIMEARASYRAVQYEVQRVLSLGQG
jgi:Flp pilus assembly protein TadB